jgi:hypothetical protein
MTNQKKATTGQAANDDPFDLDALKLSQDFSDLGVQKVLLRVPVRKPNRQEFFRVRPDDNYRLDTAVIELKEDREFYLISPDLRATFFDEVKPIRLFTAITRQGNVFLFPVTLPGPDGRRNTWHDSALEIAERAKARWCRMAADLNLGAYQCYEAAEELPDPTWPPQSLKELIKIAFGNGQMIQDPNHPVVKRLLGRS